MDKETAGANARVHRVVVIGGGFGGLYTAKALAKTPDIDVTLVDRRNHHLFQPLLYQVATGGLSPAHIAQPLRAVFKDAKNVRVLLDEVTDIDPDGCTVMTEGGAIEYDSLVVAAGACTTYFGNEDWEGDAPSLKSIEEAVAIRSRILEAFERAERCTDEAERRALLTFVVVGAGPTGVELAGTLGEIARHTLREEFRSIDPSDATVLLLEGGPKILATYTDDLSAQAQGALEDLGVVVRTGTMVEAVCAESVTVRDGDVSEVIPARTTLWAAGVKASPLAETLASATGADLDRAGRIYVDGALSPSGYENLYVIGDMAHAVDKTKADGSTLPGVAPVAMQQGAFVAKAIRRRLAGRPVGNFRYNDRGSMATIGRSKAIADLGWIRFSGFPAWIAWLFIHVLYLVEFQSRVLVLIQWAWNYFTWSRSARLITDLLRRGEADQARDGSDSHDRSDKKAAA